MPGATISPQGCKNDTVVQGDEWKDGSSSYENDGPSENPYDENGCEEEKQELDEELDANLQEFAADYQMQASLCYNVFIQEFDMYMPKKLDDDIEDICDIHSIFDDFTTLLDVTQTRRQEEEAKLAVSIIKRCNPLIAQTEMAMQKHATWKLKDEFNRALCLACAVKARTLLQKLDVSELQNVLKTLDIAFLYGTNSSDFDICSAVLLVQDRLDGIQKLPNDTRTLMRCDGQDGDEVDTDDEDRVQRLKTIYGSEIPSDEIPIEDCPSLETFMLRYYQRSEPVKLQGCMDHWPAMVKWKYINYLNRLAGPRTVPIEMGNYSRGGWGRLSTLSDYLEELHAGAPVEKCGYLAQHSLFEQEPRFRSDIIVPDYCAVGDIEDVSINIWLGPARTCSPLHYDRYANILAQVFGRKKVILYSPEDSNFFYPLADHLSNTSAVDLKKPDLEAYPEFAKAAPLICILEPGDQLFIPLGWWHFVEALDVSCSVNFFF